MHWLTLALQNYLESCQIRNWKRVMNEVIFLINILHKFADFYKWVEFYNWIEGLDLPYLWIYVTPGILYVIMKRASTTNRAIIVQYGERWFIFEIFCAIYQTTIENYYKILDNIYFYLHLSILYIIHKFWNTLKKMCYLDNFWHKYEETYFFLHLMCFRNTWNDKKI